MHHVGKVSACTMLVKSRKCMHHVGKVKEVHALCCFASDQLKSGLVRESKSGGPWDSKPSINEQLVYNTKSTSCVIRTPKAQYVCTQSGTGGGGMLACACVYLLPNFQPPPKLEYTFWCMSGRIEL